MNRLVVLFPLAALLLGGCAAVGPEYKGAPRVPAITSGLPSTSQSSAVTDTSPPDKWWRLLNDPILDRLMVEAMRNDTDLRVATENLRAARAFLVETKTGREPQMDADASLGREQDSIATHGNPLTRQNAYTATSASLGLSWELDIFGRVRRRIEEANADAGQAAALRNDVLRIVLANLASAYIGLRGAQQRDAVIRRNIDNQKRTLDLTETLFQAGAASELDVVRARAQLRDTQAALPTVQADETNALNRIALLTGRGPGQVDKELTRPGPLPTLPAFAPVGKPADLIRRRPDIRAAERALASATARIGVTTADLFPTVTFNANVGVQAAGLSNVTSGGADFFSFGPALSWNLFDRRAIYARIRQAKAGARAKLANYKGVVLRALQEVDDAVAQNLRERQRNFNLKAALADSRRAADLARTRYREGAESFLVVLDAERTLLNAEEQVTQSNTALDQSLVNIYLALGSGWQTAKM